MAGGGHIIIHNSVKKTAELRVVQDNLSADSKAKLDAILDTSTSAWTAQNFECVQECINEAYANIAP
jgi:hypothetical protein